LTINGIGAGEPMNREDQNDVFSSGVSSGTAQMMNYEEILASIDPRFLEEKGWCKEQSFAAPSSATEAIKALMARVDANKKKQGWIGLIELNKLAHEVTLLEGKLHDAESAAAQLAQCYARQKEDTDKLCAAAEDADRRVRQLEDTIVKLAVKIANS